MYIYGYNNSSRIVESNLVANIEDVIIHTCDFIDFQKEFTLCEQEKIDVMICSYDMLAEALKIAKNYKHPTLFMPSGSNKNINSFDGKIPQPICITGAGVDNNQTGYSIEFFSNSKEVLSNKTISSSLANGYIAGQISFISDYLSVGIQEARILARKISSEGGLLDINNGYGIININEIKL